MRPISSALLAKLSERWQADATDSKPNLKLIATQSSVNTLITEPIHSGIAAAYGDVALRQLPGESTPSYAYAICLDDGIAKVYGRALPADYEQAWAYLWTLGAAEDVAIEYNGTWELSGDKNFFYLITEATPWIFWVANGTLYAQKWSDNSTMLTLATGVSNVSACRTWQSVFDSTLDQGIIVAYLKSGAAYYRSYCFETNGFMAWEAERVIAELGSGLFNIQVFRTNDFRAGFMAEDATGMKWALSDRVYAGMSFRPESIVAEISPTLQVCPIITTPVEYDEDGKVSANLDTFFMCVLPADGSADLSLTGSTRVSTTQFKLNFNKKLIHPENLAPYITFTPTDTVAALLWSDADNSLLITVGTPIKLNTLVTITIAASVFTGYVAYQQQISPLTPVSASFAAQVVTTTVYTDDTITAALDSVSLTLVIIIMHQDRTDEYVTASLDALSLILQPVGTLPI